MLMLNTCVRIIAAVGSFVRRLRSMLLGARVGHWPCMTSTVVVVGRGVSDDEDGSIFFAPFYLFLGQTSLACAAPVVTPALFVHNATHE